VSGPELGAVGRLSFDHPKIADLIPGDAGKESSEVVEFPAFALGPDLDHRHHALVIDYDDLGDPGAPLSAREIGEPRHRGVAPLDPIHAALSIRDVYGGIFRQQRAHDFKVDLPVEELATGLERVAAAEQRRHDRIAEAIESTVMTGIYEVFDDYDLSSVPRPWPTPGL
jgi:hypothetical protein